MQPFESVALALFLISYTGSGLLSIVRPAAFRASELAFYTSGRLQWDELLVFATGALSFVVVLLHVFIEGPRLGQILLYLQSTLFAILLPLHFSAFFKRRMKGTLSQKNDAAYRSSGRTKLVISLAMIILPFVVR